MGWIPQILSKFADAWDFTKRNVKPGAAWVDRAVTVATPAVQVAAKAGQGIRKVGKRLSGAATGFRYPDGKPGETETKIRKAGDDAQRYGGQITALANVAKTALSVLGGLAAMFKPDPPTQIDIRGQDEPDDVPDDAPTPEGRFLPRPPPKRLPEAPSTDAPAVVEPGQPAPDPTPDDGPVDTPAEPRHRPTVPGDSAADRTPATPSPHQPAADPPSTSDPPTRTEDQPPPQPKPSPTPEPKPDDRLKGLAKVLHPRVRALGERPSREVLYPLILDICRTREWTTAKQLAGWVSMHQRSLVHRHLGPMVDAGLLVLRFPDSPRSPRQAYHTHPEKWPPSN